ncbi:MAG: SDR family NAD(P)-dependent oxidoreductase [Planctomycetaceae bacterium]|nr:SDR family NAD(P)-dependent oxidoreductase [Planctomycetaceae bacterium]
MEQRAAGRLGDRARVAVVTGASSGIGRALARQLAAENIRVGLIARRHDALDKVASQIKSEKGVAYAAAADVGDREALHRAVRAVEESLGPVDVMVANAGFGVPTRLDPLNIAEVEATFRVNLLGVIYSIETVLPGMLRRGAGQIVAVSSLAAEKGLPGESAYCASKAAVNVYLEGLRIAVRKRGIIVTTICPGFVDTTITPMDAAATPFQISADQAARQITRAILRRRQGVIRFPWPMAALMTILRRLPDPLIARLVSYEIGEPATTRTMAG